ncbi:EAL domain-containing protein [Wenzhouxiangella sediminis]|uniref:EAL domain-containing protein n=1 Tax=Wenzhouxiangella sediminis TaxID=1792836 RepID=A0A3E1KAQ8_9GAMM|nr:EAL domain-containing protein [Wenzhouxiangella sediminis]RFF31532.1 EAL domain-containing protein [Wenzhouxiangella sediminis]
MRERNRPGFDISMAFQPIVNAQARDIFAHEALVRGRSGEPAGQVFEKVNNRNRYGFDQACRIKAIEWASRLGMQSPLSINFMPNAVYEPERCIQTTLEAAETHGFPTDRIIFEITEGERVEDPEHLDQIIRYYQAQGFLTAIDDFGAGYAGLSLLADFRTDLVKLDMGLVRDIDRKSSRQAVVRATLSACESLGIRAIAEGVETPEEYEALKSMGVSLFQGYLFARPAFEALPEVDWSALD